MARSLAVITGASSGIGMEFARQLAPAYDLLLIARRRDALEGLARELAVGGCAVAIMVADLTDPAQLGAVAERIGGEEHLALLVNNAGFGCRGAFWENRLETLEAMHRLHIMAIVRLSHAALRVLVAKNRGAVINVASVAGFAQRAGSASYGATKSWVNAFTEGLHLDLKKAKSAVSVQALCPGFTHSGFHEALGEDRTRLAPASFWLTAAEVVSGSLRALRRKQLFVVPGWRYKALVAVVTKLPLWLKVSLEG